MIRSVLRAAGLALMVFLYADPAAAEPRYTYIKASLGYPWFMFFVFLSLIAIPFLLIIVLSWRRRLKGEDSQPPPAA